MTALAYAYDFPEPASALATNDNEPPRFAAFANGYQSGSPVGGALSGALSGFAMGGPLAPITAIGGAVAGEVGKLNFSQTKEDKSR